MSKSSECTKEELLFNTLKRPPMLEVTREFASRFWEFYEQRDIFEKWLLDNGWATQDEFFRSARQFKRSPVEIRYQTSLMSK